MCELAFVLRRTAGTLLHLEPLACCLTTLPHCCGGHCRWWCWRPLHCLFVLWRPLQGAPWCAAVSGRLQGVHTATSTFVVWRQLQVAMAVTTEAQIGQGTSPNKPRAATAGGLLCHATAGGSCCTTVRAANAATHVLQAAEQVIFCCCCPAAADPLLHSAVLLSQLCCCCRWQAGGSRQVLRCHPTASTTAKAVQVGYHSAVHHGGTGVVLRAQYTPARIGLCLNTVLLLCSCVCTC